MSLLLTLNIFNYWTPFSSAFIVHFEHEIIARFGVNSSEKKKEKPDDSSNGRYFLSLSLGKIKTKVLVWKIFEKHEITILTR